MKNFIFVILFSIFLFGCATTNSVESKPRIKSDNLRLEAAMKNYVGYDELVKRGFDIHSLDYVEDAWDIYYALTPYFYDYEDGTAFDNHFGVANDTNNHLIKSKYIYFDNKFGTKEELLNEGYVENETMFYYPSNGEKDWRVGRFNNVLYTTFGGLKIEFNKKLNHSTYGFYENKNDDFIFIKIKEHPDSINTYSDFFSRAKKKNVIIIDLSNDIGGNILDGENFMNGFSSLKDKKIYCLIGQTRSCGEQIICYLKKYCSNIKFIGSNTNGIYRYGYTKLFNSSKLGLKNFCIPDVSMSLKYADFIYEGIGIFPDYWASSIEDVEKTINFDLKNNYFSSLSSRNLFNIISNCY